MDTPNRPVLDMVSHQLLALKGEFLGTSSAWVPGLLGTHRFWEVCSGSIFDKTEQVTRWKWRISYLNLICDKILTQSFALLHWFVNLTAFCGCRMFFPQAFCFYVRYPCLFILGWCKNLGTHWLKLLTRSLVYIDPAIFLPTQGPILAAPNNLIHHHSLYFFCDPQSNALSVCL